MGGAHRVPWIALPVTPPQSPTGPDTQAVTAEAAGASLPTAVGGREALRAHGCTAVPWKQGAIRPLSPEVGTMCLVLG